jgi:hypothetical protein
MATQERARITNGLVRKLGIIAFGAGLVLAACGTSEVRSGTIQTTGERQSVLGDPENPYWSRNTAVFEASKQQSRFGDPGNPHWSRNTATETTNDTVDQPHPRPY